MATEIMGDSIEDVRKAVKDTYQMIHGYWITQIVYVIAELGVPDLIHQHGPQTAEELASKLNCNPTRLFRVLRAYNTLGGVTVDEQKRFGLTPISKILLSDHPMSQRNVARLNGSSEWYGSWMYLIDMVRGGETGWIQHNKTEIYQYMTDHPQHSEVFNAAMMGYSRAEEPALVRSYDFGIFGTIADVGGGTGSLLLRIAAKHPSVKTMLIEREEVQKENEKNEKLANVQKITSDMFAPGGVPSGADAYILKNVVNDHSIEKNVILLKNIHEALRTSENPNKCLLIMQHLIAEKNNKEFSVPKFLDLAFLVLRDSQELTLTEYEEMAKQAGFVFSKTTPEVSENSTGVRYIIEFKPVY